MYKVPYNLPSFSLDILPNSLNIIWKMILLFHVIFFPTAMIFPSPLHNLIFFPKKLIKKGIRNFIVYTPLLTYPERSKPQAGGPQLPRQQRHRGQRSAYRNRALHEVGGYLKYLLCLVYLNCLSYMARATKSFGRCKKWCSSRCRGSQGLPCCYHCY